MNFHDSNYYGITEKSGNLKPKLKYNLRYPLLTKNNNNFITASEYLSNSFKVEIGNHKTLDLQLVQSPYLFLNLTDMIPKLCVKGLMSHSYNGLESPNVIIIDGGVNGIDFYKIIGHAQSAGLDLDVVLDRIILSRSFTINQLANIVIWELPELIQRYKTKLVIITNLSDMSNHSKIDYKITEKENDWLLSQMIDVIKQIARYSIVTVFSSTIIKQFAHIVSYC